MTEWMSEAVSDWSSADEAECTSRYKEMAEKTGTRLADLLDGSVKVLEYRALGWRSEAVSLLSLI